MSTKESCATKEKKFYEIDEDTARQDYLDNVFIGEVKSLCECSDSNNWCRSCNATRFQKFFFTWTSGNKEIDYFIQNTQIYAYDWALVLEWYPWEEFSGIEEIGKGGYGTVFRAKRRVGRITAWNHKKNWWIRSMASEYIALKTIEHSEFPEHFLNEAKRLQRWAYQSSQSSRFRDLFYGFTKNETTGQFLLVLKYFPKGDLRTPQLWGPVAEWYEKRTIIYEIAKGLEQIHQAGMIHRDLHPGNLLYISYDQCQISDLGLCIFESEARDIKEVKGVMPYLAPELLNGRSSYSQKTDIYALGIIMWEIASEEKPFYEYDHDLILAIHICEGLRPEIIDMPPPYQWLMQRCWHANPTKRPTATEIVRMIDSFPRGDEIWVRLNKGAKKEKKTPSTGAIYISRLLTNTKNEIASMNLDFEIPE